MAWLTRDAQVLATVDDRGDRSGVRLVEGPALVHTLGGGTPVDVAWCRRRDAPTAPSRSSPPVLEVQRVATLGSWRLGRPCPPGRVVVVAGAGAFERWRLQVGDRLEVEGE